MIKVLSMLLYNYGHVLASTSSMHECAVPYNKDMEIATMRLLYVKTYHINAISVNGPTTQGHGEVSY